MKKAKPAKYIITESVSDRPDLADMRTRILHLDQDVVPGAFHVDCVWYVNGSDKVLVEPHTHDFDEVLGFIGSDPKNPHALGAEVELWLDGEKQVINRSSMVFIPRGMRHCPMIVRKVERPFFHFGTVAANKYSIHKTK